MLYQLVCVYTSARKHQSCAVNNTLFPNLLCSLSWEEMWRTHPLCPPGVKAGGGMTNEQPDSWHKLHQTNSEIYSQLSGWNVGLPWAICFPEDPIFFVCALKMSLSTITQLSNVMVLELQFHPCTEILGMFDFKPVCLSYWSKPSPWSIVARQE